MGQEEPAEVSSLGKSVSRPESGGCRVTFVCPMDCLYRVPWMALCLLRTFPDTYNAYQRPHRAVVPGWHKLRRQLGPGLQELQFRKTRSTRVSRPPKGRQNPLFPPPP